jgi:hypothetical protein
MVKPPVPEMLPAKLSSSPSRIRLPVAPSILPLMLALLLKMKVSSELPPVRLEKVLKLRVLLTVPLLLPVIFQVLAVLVPTRVLPALPMLLQCFGHQEPPDLL